MEIPTLTTFKCLALVFIYLWPGFRGNFHIWQFTNCFVKSCQGNHLRDKRNIFRKEDDLEISKIICIRRYSGPNQTTLAIYFPPFYRNRLVHYLTPYQILWTFCGWISGQCKCKWELSVPSLTEAPRSLLPYNGKGFIFSDDNSLQDDFFYRAQ